MTPQPPPGSPPRAPEGSLSETREELELIFNLVPDLICVASAEGFFTRVNPAWEKTLGWMPVGLLAQPFEKFVHPDDLQKTRDQFASQLSGGSAIHFVNRYRTRSGDYRWLDWVATPITGGASVYAAARDITERKRAEELENAQRERECPEFCVTGSNLIVSAYDAETEERKPGNEHDSEQSNLVREAV